MTKPGLSALDSPSDSSIPKRIRELDGLRAVAVILVVAHHVYNYSGSLPGVDWVKQSLGHLGLAGVQLFFVISGFIITKLLVREYECGGRISLRAFFVRRFFRIVPPFAAYFVFLVLLKKAGLVEVSTQNLWVSAAFLGNWGLFDSNSWLLAHTWSLAVEEQFYLLFPPVLCVLLGVGRGLILAVTSALYLACLYFFDFFDFIYILAGVIWAVNEQRFRHGLTDRSRWWPFVFAGLLLAVRFSGMTELCPHVKVHLFEPLVCAGLVAWFVYNPDKCAPLRWAPVQAIGACSYSIYLWQQLFTGPSTAYGSSWNPAGFPLSLLWLALSAGLSYFLIEKTSLRLGRFVSMKIRAKPAD